MLSLRQVEKIYWYCRLERRSNVFSLHSCSLRRDERKIVNSYGLAAYFVEHKKKQKFINMPRKMFFRKEKDNEDKHAWVFGSSATTNSLIHWYTKHLKTYLFLSKLSAEETSERERKSRKNITKNIKRDSLLSLVFRVGAWSLVLCLHYVQCTMRRCTRMVRKMMVFVRRFRFIAIQRH